MPWIQLNVGLERSDGSALPSARALFGALQPLVAELKAAGLLRRFFFMRKPPDVRLRFEGDEPEAALAPAIGKALAALREAGAISTAFRSVYEPEVTLFGGPEAMDVMHTYFDADTAGWMAMDRVAVNSQRTVAKTNLVTAVLNDLFEKVLDDANEIWDVWRNIRRLVPSEPDPDNRPAGMHSLASLILPPASAGEVQALIAYDRANTTAARELLDVWSSGRLQCGLRGLLAYVALFSFNRYGLSGEVKAAIAEGMDSLWDPMRGLAGGEAQAPPRGASAG
jgi:thiopeptide-type bacteriocin biosynthesis protein